MKIVGQSTVKTLEGNFWTNIKHREVTTFTKYLAMIIKNHILKESMAVHLIPGWLPEDTGARLCLPGLVYTHVVKLHSAAPNGGQRWYKTTSFLSEILTNVTLKNFLDELIGKTFCVFTVSQLCNKTCPNPGLRNFGWRDPEAWQGLYQSVSTYRFSYHLCIGSVSRCCWAEFQHCINLTLHKLA